MKKGLTVKVIEDRVTILSGPAGCEKSDVVAALAPGNIPRLFAEDGGIDNLCKEMRKYDLNLGLVVIYPPTEFKACSGLKSFWKNTTTKFSNVHFFYLENTTK